MFATSLHAYRNQATQTPSFGTAPPRIAAAGVLSAKVALHNETEHQRSGARRAYFEPSHLLQCQCAACAHGSAGKCDECTDGERLHASHESNASRGAIPPTVRETVDSVGEQTVPVARALQGALQPKLAIGHVDDPLEHEADRVADHVLHMPDAIAQRQCASCTAAAAPIREDETQPQLQRWPGSDPGATEVASDFASRLGPGEPLDPASRAYFEPRFGRDLSHVRIHTDARAAESARSIKALAYAVGSDLVFGAGQHAPATYQGRRLLAHELTHTLQRNRGRPAARYSSISAAHEPTLARQESDAGVDDEIRDAGLPGGVETPAGGVETPAGGVETPAGGAETSAGGVCTAVMGGRGIEYLPGNAAGWFFNHTYVNFRENASNYWLIEGGPLPTDSTKSGAWAKPSAWETRGNRRTTSWTANACPAVKKLLLDTASIYHAKGLPYSPFSGPNSNSFAEHLTYKAGVQSDFHWGADKAYDYWQSHPRPS